MEFYNKFCKRCPFFERFEEENPRGQALIHCKPFTCPVYWREGYQELNSYQRRKLTKVFPEKVLKEEWEKSDAPLATFRG
jgi:hypothetical protein